MSVDTVTGNKLIAKFLGLYVTEFNGIYHFVCKEEQKNKDLNQAWLFRLEEAKYHESWDWLMPVCKKINDLQPVEGQFKEMEEWWDLIDNSVTQNYDIKDVFPFVVEFIKYYNSLTKKDKQ